MFSLFLPSFVIVSSYSIRPRADMEPESDNQMLQQNLAEVASEDFNEPRSERDALAQV